MSSSACPCEQPQHPQVVTNPPGLSTISCRVDDFSGFRRALLEPLTDEVALLGWQPAPGDLGLQILEWWAYLGDILTFYNERIANEDYLRTAEQSARVVGLVALLGYRRRPAISAVGQVAALRKLTRPKEPVVIPGGMQVVNTATPGVPVQTFEAAAASFSGVSDVSIALPPGTALLEPMSSATDLSLLGSVLLSGKVTSLKPGEELLAVWRDWTNKQYWAELSVVSLDPEPDPGGGINTRVTLDAAQVSEAKDWMAGAGASDVRLLRSTQRAALWTQTGDLQALTNSDTTTLTIELSAAVRGVSAGDFVFLDGGSHGAAVGLVTDVMETFTDIPYPGSPPNTAPIAVAHTELTTLTPNADLVVKQFTDPASVVVRFGLTDVGTPIGTPQATLTGLPVTVGAPMHLTVPTAGLEAFVEDPTGAGILVNVTASGPGEVTLTASLETPDEFSLGAPLRLLVDLIEVSRGATVAAERLGTGDATIAGQTFALAKSPLTYFATSATYASTLRIAVDGIRWSEAATFYGQPADATVFVASQLPDGTTQIRFGDGINGARLPTGSHVEASYRYGAGAAAPPAGRLTTILSPQPNLASIHNPVAVGGGADAEQPADVRQNGPASVLTFGRAISADDYETVAALAPGVARARAYWTWDPFSQRALVKVFVGDDPAAAAAAANALAGAEDPNRPVVVASATAVELTVRCTLLIAADRVVDDVVAAATAALSDHTSGLFSPGKMAIGQTLYSSELEAALMVAGVDAVHGLTVSASGNEIFASEPIGLANPGEGAFYALSSFEATPVVDDG